jgi:hypothetical protein
MPSALYHSISVMKPTSGEVISTTTKAAAIKPSPTHTRRGGRERISRKPATERPPGGRTGPVRNGSSLQRPGCQSLAETFRRRQKQPLSDRKPSATATAMSAQVSSLIGSSMSASREAMSRAV